MDTRTLIEVINTRIASSDNNPTKKSLLYEIVTHLEELQRYQQDENSKSSEITGG